MIADLKYHPRMIGSTWGRWMRAEILEQPEVLARVVDRERRGAEYLGGLLRRRGVRLVVLAGRGSSDHAAILGKYIFEWGLGVPAALAAPSIATLYHRSLRLRDAAVIGISQSGRSPDVAEYVARARASGAITVAVTNDPASPLAKAAQYRLLCHAGEERSVAATKTFTAELACLYLLTAGWAGGRFGRRILAGLERVPDALREALGHEERIAEIMRRYRAMERCVVLGRGFAFPVALETALKLKETAGIFAEGASAADFFHGPIAMAGRQVGAAGLHAIFLASKGPGRVSLRQAEQRLRATGVQVVTFGPPVAADWLSPFPLAVFGQLAALHLSRHKGLDADHPRGLRKVTRTR